MDNIVSEEKFKWEMPSDPTKFELHYPPVSAPREAWQWDCWVSSMMMDTRFSATARAVLARLALHYNLRTGECFPSHTRLAVETGTKSEGVRHILRKAEKLGWIKRKWRKGGPSGNLTNMYELTLPKSIFDCLKSIGATGVATPPTGVEIGATGVAAPGDRCGYTPITGKGNREAIEEDSARFARGGRGFWAKAGSPELSAWEDHAAAHGYPLDYSRKWGGAQVPSQWPPTE